MALPSSTVVRIEQVSGQSCGQAPTTVVRAMGVLRFVIQRGVETAGTGTGWLLRICGVVFLNCSRLGGGTSRGWLCLFLAHPPTRRSAQGSIAPRPPFWHTSCLVGYYRCLHV